METIEINEGGLWEDKAFKILIDFELDEDIADSDRCRHVKDNKVRAVVIATNEGGFNSTGVCVDCLIEAFKDNNLL